MADLYCKPRGKCIQGCRAAWTIRLNLAASLASDIVHTTHHQTTRASIIHTVQTSLSLNIYLADTQPGLAGRPAPGRWIMDSMVKEWTAFLSRCLDRRVEPALFDAATVQLHQKSPLPGNKLAALLLKPQSPNASSYDPRVLIYVEHLLALKKVDASDVLSATFHYSKDRLSKTGDDSLEKHSKWCISPKLEELVCHRLQRAFAAEERPLNNTEGLKTLIILTRWMQAMVTSHTSDTMMQAMAGIQHQPQQHSIDVREALGVLAVGVVENSKILMILNHPTAKGRSRVTSIRMRVY